MYNNNIFKFGQYWLQLSKFKFMRQNFYKISSKPFVKEVSARKDRGD